MLLEGKARGTRRKRGKPMRSDRGTVLNVRKKLILYYLTMNTYSKHHYSIGTSSSTTATPASSATGAAVAGWSCSAAIILLRPDRRVPIECVGIEGLCLISCERPKLLLCHAK
jgi:hypothetical protein